MGDRRSSIPIRRLDFTSELFTGRLQEAGILISMDGKGDGSITSLSSVLGWVSNTTRCTVANGRLSIALWFDFYPSLQPHQAIDRMTRDEVYADLTTLLKAV